MNKKRIILPNTITIQLKDRNGNNLKVPNILCHLNIFLLDNSGYYTFTHIPSNYNGQIILSKEQILKNTELKYNYNPLLPIEEKVTRFEFFILDKNNLYSLIETIDSYISVNMKDAKNELEHHGLTGEQIIKATSLIKQKMDEDRALKHFLKKNSNQQFEYSEEKTKITDIWREEGDYFYTLKLQP